MIKRLPTKHQTTQTAFKFQKMPLSPLATTSKVCWAELVAADAGKARFLTNRVPLRLGKGCGNCVRINRVSRIMSFEPGPWKFPRPFPLGFCRFERFDRAPVCTILCECSRSRRPRQKLAISSLDYRAGKIRPIHSTADHRAVFRRTELGRIRAGFGRRLVFRCYPRFPFLISMSKILLASNFVIAVSPV